MESMLGNLWTRCFDSNCWMRSYSGNNFEYNQITRLWMWRFLCRLYSFFCTFSLFRLVDGNLLNLIEYTTKTLHCWKSAEKKCMGELQFLNFLCLIFHFLHILCWGIHGRLNRSKEMPTPQDFQYLSIHRATSSQVLSNISMSEVIVVHFENLWF